MTLDQLQHFQNSPWVILLLVLEEYLKETGVENQSPEAIDLLMKIIKKGHTDVDYRDAVGNTFLMCASIKKHLNVVKFSMFGALGDPSISFLCHLSILISFI